VVAHGLFAFADLCSFDCQVTINTYHLERTP